MLYLPPRVYNHLAMIQRGEDLEPSGGRHYGDAWQAAIDFGIDVSQIEYLLTLTPTQRLERHAQALETVRAVREAGKRYYGFDPRYPETPG